ncbi:hypothetical protein MH215_05285 [Paenibacillus sp. ACRSA]|uniref:hypothetical protein n=1 Tax=Paenibacillus sp. ACRSA TaxID=2918211 RepID=UPI001EF48C3C|nr:hypothetical protein [Paenibacillus sp. ACRSA]MCG7376397.1 hypothetical protein [Paenibacillus sp. ACRSA]
MRLEAAVSKINSINWGNIGNFTQERYFGFEYLRRLSQFYKNKQLKAKSPAFANLPRFLGDIEWDMDISTYFSADILRIFEDNQSIRNIVLWYLQLARYSDKCPEASQYLSVYEPLINLLECGGEFFMNNAGLEIKNEGYYPFNNWFERFVDAEPRDINHL